MKKLLLIVFAVLSMNAFAQAPKLSFKANNVEGTRTAKFKTQRSLQSIVGRENLKPVAKAPAKAPEGTKSIYYMDCAQSVLGQKYLCNRNHVSSEIIISDDGKAYITNFFYNSLLGNDLYIEGTVNADGSIEIGYQQLTSYDGTSLYVSNVDVNSGGDADTQGTFKLNYDSQYNVYYSDENSYLGFYVTDNYGSLTLDEYCGYFTYYPSNYFPEATTHNYSFIDYEEQPQSTTVNMIDAGGGYFYINNLMPGYENVWLLGYFENNDMTIYSYQLATDNCAFCFIDAVSTELQEEGTLAYNSNDKTYKLGSDMAFADVIDGRLVGYDEGGFYLNSNLLTNMVISEEGTTGISSVENNKDAVSTEYFDLSGRRINNADKGISIMRMKYADGTTKAVKVMK